jgi:hypothetical protein
MHKDPGVAMMSVTALTEAVRPVPGAPHSRQQCSEGPLLAPQA